MREPCSLKTRRVARKRPAITRGPKRSACRYASIYFCHGAGDRARRIDGTRQHR